MSPISAEVEPRSDSDVLVFSNEHWLLEVGMRPILDPRLRVQLID